MQIICPRCQAVLRMEGVPAGAPVRCSACNALFSLPAGGYGAPGENGPVIDIHAEPVNGDEEPSAGDHTGRDSWEREVQGPYQQQAGDSGGRPGTRYVVIEKRVRVREGSEFGCCGCGCFLLLLFLILFFAGCGLMGVAT